MKTSADDELSLLLAVRSDVIGDVQIIPSGLPGLPGVQDKISARVPPCRRGRGLLLRPGQEYPHQRGDASVVLEADGRPGLLVRRFDRIAQPSGSTLALAREDACQVLGRWPADKYNLTSEQAVQGFADQCAARPVTLRSLPQ